MTRSRILVVVAVLAVLLLGLLLMSGAPVREELATPLPAGDLAADASALPPGGDFVLDSADGSLDLAQLRGKVVLVYFGYATCPDICPTNLGFIGLALRELTPAELERTEVVFISVDPQRDNPARLRDYVAYFHPKMRGVTGSPEAVAQIAKRYGAVYRRVEMPESALGYLVDHSAWTYVVAPDGQLVERMEHATPPEQILATIRRHLGGAN